MKSLIFFLFLSFFSSLCYSQLINCPNASVYFYANGQIIEQPLPLPAASTTVLTGLPPSSNGLGIGPPFGFNAPNPTFWTTSGGTYWYYDGLNWINTNHLTGNPAAVNIGSGGSCLYNLVGGSGQVYSYNGTGNGTLVTTVSGFSGGGPYDIGADMNDNFYLVKATTPNPSLIIFSPAGVAICSYSLSNLPAVTNGGGFAIINNLIAVFNSGFNMGSINPAFPQITFTAQSLVTSPTDFANCVIPVPTGAIFAPNGGVLNCANITLPLVGQVVPGGIGMLPGPPSSTLTASNFTWSGPGIISGQYTPTITINLPGVYSFSVASSGCPMQMVTKSFSVNSQGLLITPTITAPTCFSGPTTLTLNCNVSLNNISWTGPGISGAFNTNTLNISASGIYGVQVTNTLGCSGSATVNIQAPPVITLALSASSICAQGSNGSPNSLSIGALGAPVLSLIAGPNFSYSSVSPWVCSPAGPAPAMVSLASATVIGSNGVCTGSAVASFSIIPNPTIAITPSVASVCSGFSKSFTASGATTYNWLPGFGLNTFTGANVQVNTLVSGIYTAYGSSQGCSSATQNNTLIVLPIPTVFANPASSTVCAGNVANLSASGSATSFTWTSSGGPSQVMAPSMNVNAITTTTCLLIGSLNSCTNSATATITTVPPPFPSMILSSNTLCAQPVNGSPNSINVTPFGATSYTLLSGANYSVTSAFGPMGMTIFPTGSLQSGISLATATLLGSNGYCQVAATMPFSIIPNPVISSFPTTAIICPGRSQALTATGATTYSWLVTNPGLNTYNGNYVVATPAVTTVYSVIGESLGCRSMAQVNVVNISPMPNVSIIASSPTICVGTSLQLSASGSATSYSWLDASGISLGTGNNISVSPTSSGSYGVVGSLNSCTTSAIVSISVIPAPNLLASASAYTVCSGSNINLHVSGANSYSWSPTTSGLHSIFGQDITAVPTSNTTFTVRGFNGTCAGYTTVTVKAVPIPNITIDAPYNQVCAGGTIPMKAFGAQYFDWKPATVIPSANGGEVICTPGVTTNYTISGYNADGPVACSQQVSYSVMVLPYAKAVVGANKNICEGESVGLSVSGGDTYKWSPDASLNKTTGSLVTARPLVSTVYRVESSFNGECAASNTIAIIVNEKPKVFAGRDTLFNGDEMIKVKATGTGTLKWISGENIACAECPETKVSPRVHSCYIVEVTNTFGCKASDEVCIHVTDNFYVWTPNAFTPNGDGLNDVFLIFGTGLSNISMDIYNRWGVHLFSSNSQENGWDGSFKGEPCIPGIYTYKISYKGLSGKFFEKVGSVSVSR